MSLSYRLTLAGDATADEIAERAFPNPNEQPSRSGALLSVDLYDSYGFGVTVRTGRNGYVDAGADDIGQWEWKPDPYAALSFDVDDDIDRKQLATNLVTVIKRILSTGPEDAAFVVNGDYLLAARFDGRLVKHNHDRWWSYYPEADQVIFG
jgi:hypothetical protein